jgi:deoxyribodipyrimidine photo-lyase
MPARSRTVARGARPRDANVRPNDPRVRVWNARPIVNGDYVVYWSQSTRRADDNVALEHAIARANDLDLPVVVYESLRSDYPHASSRFHAFVLDCARDASRAYRERGIAHGFFLPRTRDEARGVAAQVFSRAALVVSDEHPSFVFPAQNAAAASHAPCAYVTVEDTCVVPLALVPGHEVAARTIRGKLHARLDEWLAPVKYVEPRRAGVEIEWPFDPVDLAGEDLGARIAECAIDHGVARVDDRPGGAIAAAARLRDFLARAAKRYDTERDASPIEGATSGLSPYLHFGAISARACLLAVRDAALPTAARDAFVDQLLVRRGLAFNHAARRADHARYSSVPEWARSTLAAHARDPRPEARACDELEAARSGDSVWNAAQRELVVRGRIHNVLRMFWGKRLLSLVASAEDCEAAFDFGVRMFDRYALDGRDPNTYAGVGWCFGLHDQPFPERPIFGKVRPMGLGALARRFDVDAYVQSIPPGENRVMGVR